MSHVPELIQTTKLGGTVHSYNLPGGKREFTRFLACYLGSCKFCNDMEEAIAYLSTVEVLPE